MLHDYVVNFHDHKIEWFFINMVNYLKYGVSHDFIILRAWYYT